MVWVKCAVGGLEVVLRETGLKLGRSLYVYRNVRSCLADAAGNPREALPHPHPRLHTTSSPRRAPRPPRHVTRETHRTSGRTGGRDAGPSHMLSSFCQVASLTRSNVHAPHNGHRRTRASGRSR
eukprot:3885871-Prymnesium_polylepis.2